jgi:hypothetical protein
MSLETIALLKELMSFIFVPLFVWIWFTDRKINKLELTAIKNDDLKEFHNKLEEIRKDIYSLNDSFISQKSCDFRHNSK